MEQHKINVKTAKFLKKYLDDVVFLELKKDIPSWKMKLPLPVSVQSVASQVRSDKIESISAEAIIQGVATIMGADPDFKYNLEYIEQIKTISDDVMLTILSKGLAFAEEGLFLEAILYFNAALVLDENSVDALFNMGRAFDDLYKKDENKLYLPFIKHCYTRASELEPSLGLAFYALGFFYYNEEQYSNAELNWIKALNCSLDIEIREEIVTALGKVRDYSIFEQGREYVINGRIEEGFELLKSIEELHDDWWQLNFFIGFALRMQENYEEALPYFLKVLSLNSGSVQSMNEAGICLIALGDYDQALKYYKEALRLSPKNPEYLCNKGIVFYNMRQYDDAYINIEEAHKLAPEDEVISMWFSHILKYIDFNS